MSACGLPRKSVYFLPLARQYFVISHIPVLYTTQCDRAEHPGHAVLIGVRKRQEVNHGVLGVRLRWVVTFFSASQVCLSRRIPDLSERLVFEMAAAAAVFGNDVAISAELVLVGG
jgi:hypothetical protein